jgi:hypothetical protein
MSGDLDVKGVIAYETSRNRSQSGWDKLHGLAIAASPSFPSFETAIPQLRFFHPAGGRNFGHLAQNPS